MTSKYFWRNKTARIQRRVFAKLQSYFIASSKAGNHKLQFIFFPSSPLCRFVRNFLIRQFFLPSRFSFSGSVFRKRPGVKIASMIHIISCQENCQESNDFRSLLSVQTIRMNETNKTWGRKKETIINPFSASLFHFQANSATNATSFTPFDGRTASGNTELSNTANPLWSATTATSEPSSHHQWAAAHYAMNSTPPAISGGFSTAAPTNGGFTPYNGNTFGATDPASYGARNPLRSPPSTTRAPAQPATTANGNSSYPSPNILNGYIEAKPANSSTSSSFLSYQHHHPATHPVAHPHQHHAQMDQVGQQAHVNAVVAGGPIQQGNFQPGCPVRPTALPPQQRITQHGQPRRLQQPQQPLPQSRLQQDSRSYKEEKVEGHPGLELKTDPNNRHTHHHNHHHHQQQHYSHQSPDSTTNDRTFLAYSAGIVPTTTNAYPTSPSSAGTKKKSSRGSTSLNSDKANISNDLVRTISAPEDSQSKNVTLPTTTLKHTQKQEHLPLNLKNLNNNNEDNCQTIKTSSVKTDLIMNEKIKPSCNCQSNGATEGNVFMHFRVFNALNLICFSFQIIMKIIHIISILDQLRRLKT